MTELPNVIGQTIGQAIASQESPNSGAAQAATPQPTGNSPSNASAITASVAYTINSNGDLVLPQGTIVSLGAGGQSASGGPSLPSGFSTLSTTQQANGTYSGTYSVDDQATGQYAGQATFTTASSDQIFSNKLLMDKTCIMSLWMPRRRHS